MNRTYPLTNRAASDILFRRPQAGLSAAALLGAASRLAGALEGRTVVNACRDRAAFTAGFLATILANGTTLLTGDRSPSGLAALADSFGEFVCLVDEEGEAEAGTLLVDLRSSDRASAFAPPEIDADRLVALVFTSGSTGRPVAYEKRWGALVERSLAAAACFDLAGPSPSAIVGTVPPQHMYGFETTLLLPLHTPTTSWSGSDFYPSDIQEALDRMDAPRVLVTTPLHIQAMLRADTSLPALAKIISATAPLASSLAAEAEARWDTRVLEIFGATEVGSIASRRTTAGDTWRLYPGVRLWADGASGKPRIEAPFAPQHPLDDLIEQLSADEFRLVGRPTDMVKLGGRRASLSGLNQILNEIAGIADGVFVAPPDLETSSSARLTAFVVAPDLSGDEILAALRERVEPVFLPRRIVHLDALPRNSLGKLPREKELALLERTRSGERIAAGVFTIDPAHPALPGHFPGRPVVPGVILLTEALALIAQRTGGRVAGFESVKFLAPVLPGQIVAVEFTEARSGRIAFACSVEGRSVLRAMARIDGPASRDST